MTLQFWNFFEVVQICYSCPSCYFYHTVFLYCAKIVERIEERERRRHRKDRDERRRDLEIQRAEEAKWGRNKHQPVMQLDSQIHFPEFSSNQEADPPLPSSTTCEAESLDYSQQHGPSFAQVPIKLVK